MRWRIARNPALCAILHLILGCSGATEITVDRSHRYQVGEPTRIEDDGPQVSYSGPAWPGTWFPSVGGAYSGGTHRAAMDAGAWARLPFVGTGVAWIAYRDEWSGVARVRLDEAVVAEVDLHASPAQPRAVAYSANGLAPGSHTLTIEVTGTRGPRSSGAWVSLDAFDVVPSGEPEPPKPPAPTTPPIACGLGDAEPHAPAMGGPYPYAPAAGWLPGRPGFPARGESYVDPVFGCAITRLTDGFPGWGSSYIYAKNGFWSADGARYAHDPDPTGRVDVIDARTGAPVRHAVPFDGEASFDPVDADVFYHAAGSVLHRYSIAAANDVAWRTFDAPLGPLGASVDWIDRTGRWFLVNVGGALRIWDRTADMIYDGAIPARFATGWAGLSPDGGWVVQAAPDGYWSYRVDPAARRLSNVGTMFWSLCGDHGDLASASDGRTYLVTHDCWDEAAVYRVDVSLAQSAGDVAKQTRDNRRLFAIDWRDSGHVSCGAKGAGADWCAVSVESGDDAFAGGGAWRPYEQEIVLVQLVAPYVVRRLAHHRSKSPFASYTYAPRVNASWDANRIAWASNFGFDGGAIGYSDVWVVTP